MSASPVPVVGDIVSQAPPIAAAVHANLLPLGSEIRSFCATGAVPPAIISKLTDRAPVTRVGGTVNTEVSETPLYGNAAARSMYQSPADGKPRETVSLFP
jgi:hypothetical protein